MRSKVFHIVCAGAVALTTVAGAQPDSPLRFRGVGSSRQTLDSMQLKPFDQSLWSQLSDWSGDPINPEALSGKVVMIVTWASWHRVSHPAVRSAQALWQKYHDQGLVVVGVHNPRGFETAAAMAKELGVTFPFAADKDGKFRAGLLADQDPNIYFIDRCGNLRFAQIETASAEDATARLIAETTDQARNVPKDLASKRDATERDRWKTSDIKAGAVVEGTDVAFTAPEDEAYQKVKWPYIIGKVEKDDVLERMHNDPPKLALPADDEWMPSQPKRAGRLTVIYFVDPRNTDMLRVLPVMNALHDQYKRDLIVVGAMAKAGQALKGDTGEDEKHKQRNRELIDQMLQSHPINHYLTPKVMRAENLEFSEESLAPRLSQQRETFGFAILLSSDDKIRWLGNPYSEDLHRSIDKLIAVDPGVQARRKAEQAKAGK